jgi:hypothetical protein
MTTKINYDSNVDDIVAYPGNRLLNSLLLHQVFEKYFPGDIFDYSVEKSQNHVVLDDKLVTCINHVGLEYFRDKGIDFVSVPKDLVCTLEVRNGLFGINRDKYLLDKIIRTYCIGEDDVDNMLRGLLDDEQTIKYIKSQYENYDSDLSF